MANQHKQKRDLQGLVMITVLILIIGFGVYAAVQQFVSNDTLQGQNKKPQNDPFQKLYAAQPTIGNKDSKVKLIEFGDYKCPACKRFMDEIFPKLKQEYIDTGKVSFTYGMMAFLGDDSITAANGGQSIFKQNPDAFWKYHHLVFEQQGPESQNWANPNFLLDLVKKNIPEVDANKLEQDLKNNTYVEEINKIQLTANLNGVDSTPSLFINGVRVERPLDYASVKAAIDQALQEETSK